MSVSSRALVELILLGPISNRRQLQDSPILGDVWIAFAAQPDKPMDLLITPYKSQPAGRVARAIADRISKMELPRGGEPANVAYLQGFIAARLFFRELLQVVAPMTHWWRDPKVQEGLRSYANTKDVLRDKMEAIVNWAQTSNKDTQSGLDRAFTKFSAWDQYAALAGIVLWATKQPKQEPGSDFMMPKRGDLDDVISEVDDLLRDIQQEDFPKEAQIWQISLNRKAMVALEKSVPSVKGDAARTLFNVKCEDIKWAILDSGIDSTHPVFKDKDGKSRVVKAFDFSNIRKIVSLDNLDMAPQDLEQWLGDLREGLAHSLSEEAATDILKALANDAENDRPINWEQVERLIEIKPTTPQVGHGTHVAGIIGAKSEAPNEKAKEGDTAEEGNGSEPGHAGGMCQDIKLYDFRVLSNSLQDTEFAIIAALQYIRYLNERHAFISIHGVNLSLSIPHDVRNFACGRTPVCDECERLVASGVVVVAAAGNLGYQSFETRGGSYEGYTAFSITDPGNADGVITVGSTHRNQPHTYGVSFFSSRGPTGDGRMKPDLVAPGERIQSSLPNNEWGELDGTSMAAPHVSGAAAMLMARYPELIGQPRRIKSILCESATDLGRERSFQGHGMLDVLRAFQMI